MAGSGIGHGGGPTQIWRAARPGRAHPAVNFALLLHQPLDSGADMPRALSLGRELSRRGHHVDVLCERPGPGFPAVESPCDISYGPRFAPSLLRDRGLHPGTVLSRRRWLAGGRFDVVYTFGVRPSVVLPARWAQDGGARWIVDWSDYWGWRGIAAQRAWPLRLTLGALDAWLERSSLRAADGVVAVSSFLASLAAEWGAQKSNVLRLGGGADVETIQPLDRDKARRALNLDRQAPMVLFSGRSTFDLKLVGETFRLLRRARPDLRLLLIGGARPADLGLTSSRGIDAMGFLDQPRMARALACGDVMLLPLPDAPFNRARFPNRLGDYLAAGRPVVTNPTGDAGDFVIEERVGLAVGEDPESMARAVLELLEDPDRARRMGARARRVAEEKLSWTKLAERVEAFCGRL